MADLIPGKEFEFIAANRGAIDRCNSLRGDGCTKVIDFNPAYVTCLTCDACYSPDQTPVYCHKFNCPIDPRKVLENMSRAKGCGFWFPEAIGRETCGAEYRQL